MTSNDAARVITFDPEHMELVLRDATAAYGASCRAGSQAASDALRGWHGYPSWWPVKLPLPQESR